MSEQPDDRVPRAVTGDPEAEGEIDSEPRRKWKPNPELLRALAETRKDLRPGEASLFWDWTRTRDSAPEAEDLRPSGEGEVLVSDKDAAAAYVPPKEVSPAARPRPWTKSRIRVREDVDPRRQPTVRSRGSESGREASGGSRPSQGDEIESASFARESAGSFPGLTPSDPGTLGEEEDRRRRGRRLAWAVPLGLIAATIVFLWLQLPSRGSAEGGPPSRTAAPQGLGGASSRGDTRGAAGGVVLDPEPALASTALTAGGGAAQSASASVAAPRPVETTRPARPLRTAEPKTVSSSAPETAPKVSPVPAGPPEEGGFLIRKKGDGSR